MRRTKLIIAAFLGLSSSPAFACGPDTDCVIGDRTYRIAMPEMSDAGPVGAVVFAHGYRGSAAGIMRNRGLRSMVSDMGLALIALKSAGDDWVLPNAPRHMDSDGEEEFAYVDAVIQDASLRYDIDTDQMMATGFSAGGMLVWNLACARPASFAGFAPISGTFWLEPQDNCKRPAASIVHIHGDTDRTVPLNGRAIGPTIQGQVKDALSMYGSFGGFETLGGHPDGDLNCMNSRNRDGDIMNFCLFEGGHSFRNEFVRFAWETFKEAGQL